MYNNESQFHDPKGQGQPPPYNDGPPTDVRNMPYTDNAPPVHHTQHAPPPMMPRPVMAQPGVVYQANVNMMPAVIPVVVGPQMGPKESPMTCPSCNHQIVTRVEYKTSLRTHLFAALLCVIGCWPCAFVPYFVDSCRNADHYCPNCNSYIGSYIS
uniref:LITAF domain-containing protein n=1 Tax=Heliothis virescens TaxID=7102 RepID=A0A2A4JWY3_HELVI